MGEKTKKRNGAPPDHREEERGRERETDRDREREREPWRRSHGQTM